MMVLELKQIDILGYECFDAVIATIANFYNKECHLMALGQWSFGYKYKGHSTIGGCIDTYLYREHNCLHDYHGLHFIQVEKKDVFEVINNNKPLIVQMDLYDCFWDLDYKKYHFLHFIIMYGYDEKKREVYCLDPFLKKNSITLSFEEIELYCKGSFVLDIGKKKEYNFNKELMYDIAFLKQNNCYGQMNNFCADIKNKLNWKYELQGYQNDLYAVPLLNKIRIILTNRIGYVRMLEIEREKDHCLPNDIIQEAKTIVSKWKQLNIRLMKDCISQRFQNNIQISNSVLELCNMEINLWNWLEKLIMKEK